MYQNTGGYSPITVTGLPHIKNHHDLNKRLEEAGNRLMCLTFAAGWCEPCRSLLADYSAVMAECHDVYFVLVDVDECGGLQTYFRVTMVPTVALLRQKEVIEVFVGGCPRRLRRRLDLYRTEALPASNKTDLRRIYELIRDDTYMVTESLQEEQYEQSMTRELSDSQHDRIQERSRGPTSLGLKFAPKPTTYPEKNWMIAEAYLRARREKPVAAKAPEEAAPSWYQPIAPSTVTVSTADSEDVYEWDDDASRMEIKEEESSEEEDYFKEYESNEWDETGLEQDSWRRSDWHTSIWDEWNAERQSRIDKRRTHAPGSSRVSTSGSARGSGHRSTRGSAPSSFRGNSRDSGHGPTQSSTLSQMKMSLLNFERSSRYSEAERDPRTSAGSSAQSSMRETPLSESRRVESMSPRDGRGSSAGERSRAISFEQPGEECPDQTTPITPRSILKRKDDTKMDNKAASLPWRRLSEDKRRRHSSLVAQILHYELEDRSYSRDEVISLLRRCQRACTAQQLDSQFHEIVTDEAGKELQRSQRQQLLETMRQRAAQRALLEAAAEEAARSAPRFSVVPRRSLGPALGEPSMSPPRTSQTSGRHSFRHSQLRRKSSISISTLRKSIESAATARVSTTSNSTSDSRPSSKARGKKQVTKAPSAPKKSSKTTESLSSQEPRTSTTQTTPQTSSIAATSDSHRESKATSSERISSRERAAEKKPPGDSRNLPSRENTSNTEE